ncbi:hypothetical protein [Micromonospora sp. NBRC 107095]|uniref:hypothetical protein n=1 Tax=Micromonospora sp. NBRC 107095 TaxID=3032209 RepID=UPI0024A41B36|nr:hypothetical protein [Micromonospora sp. NBRC 107095]GLZ62885.1 hypothetical protein Misp05_64610 [Micromonospora sp. NBRC 107095]
MTRAANMQALTDDVKRQWPGVVVYGIGDAAHKTRASDHNEDDTPGSKAAQSDPDGRAEHRAIDIMVRGPFTKAAADALVARLVADPKARARLYYIIWHGYIWSRSNGWKKTKYTGSDQHTDHVHVSGLAADDENTATWPAVAKAPATSTEDDMPSAQEIAKAVVGEMVTADVWPNPYGDAKTNPTVALATYVRNTAGDTAATRAGVARVEVEIAKLAGRDFTDEPAIVAGVLAALTPEKIAAAIPPTMAKQVADELARRLVTE